jgi:endonuclease III
MASRTTLSTQLGACADRLAAAYGRPARRRSNPLSELVRTVLSQNTSDVNSGRAYRSLRRTFPTWKSAAAARPRELERSIRVGGLARIKSLRIRRILREVRGREGLYSLDALRGLSLHAAQRRLESLPGVGPKTRACVLLFACRLPAFPVDTHVHRIVRRVGLVSREASAEAVHALLEPAVPAGRALELHLNLIRLGREVCRPRTPRCECCPLRRTCQWARRLA